MEISSDLGSSQTVGDTVTVMEVSIEQHYSKRFENANLSSICVLRTVYHLESVPSGRSHDSKGTDHIRILAPSHVLFSCSPQ